MNMEHRTKGSARHEGGCEAPALGAGRALPGGFHRAVTSGMGSKK